jgi:hypothetical protein
MECTGLLGLPRHVLTFIAQCLLPPDAARLRETCSTFQALIPPRPPVTTCDGLLGHIHYCGHLLLIRINTITPANYEHINAVGMWKEGTVGTCSKKCSKDFRFQSFTWCIKMLKHCVAHGWGRKKLIKSMLNKAHMELKLRWPTALTEKKMRRMIHAVLFDAETEWRVEWGCPVTRRLGAIRGDLELWDSPWSEKELNLLAGAY